jgi:hypothetical protein
MPPYDPDDPKVGDIIGCSDGDVGVVVTTYHRYSDIGDDSFMVKVAWSSGKTLPTRGVQRILALPIICFG